MKEVKIYHYTSERNTEKIINEGMQTNSRLGCVLLGRELPNGLPVTLPSEAYMPVWFGIQYRAMAIWACMP